MKRWLIPRWMIRLLAASAIASPVHAGSCEIATQMQAAQQQEQQRRLRQLDAQFQLLHQLNALERACLDHFPQYPTQWLGNSAVMLAAFNKIKQHYCQALIDKVRHPPQASQVERNLTLPPPPVNPTAPPPPSVSKTDTPAPPRTGTGLINSLMRLFQ